MVCNRTAVDTVDRGAGMVHERGREIKKGESRKQKAEMGDSIAHIKAKAFAVRIVKFTQFLQNDKKEYVLSKQILRSGTSIGANINEANYGQSKADFVC